MPSTFSSLATRATRSRFMLTTCSRLLKSCAMPPVSRPMASIFCTWISAGLGALALGDLGHQPVVGAGQLARARGDAHLQLGVEALDLGAGVLELLQVQPRGVLAPAGPHGRHRQHAPASRCAPAAPAGAHCRASAAARSAWRERPPASRRGQHDEGKSDHARLRHQPARRGGLAAPAASDSSVRIARPRPHRVGQHGIG